MTEVITIVEDSDDAIVVTAEEVLVPASTSSVIEFTRDMTTASGEQVVTGVGFTPRLVLFHTALVGGAVYASMASATAANQGGIYVNDGLASSMDASGLVGSVAGAYQVFTVTSLDADGFTLAWTKTGSPTGTAKVFATCFR